MDNYVQNDLNCEEPAVVLETVDQETTVNEFFLKSTMIVILVASLLALVIGGALLI